VTLCGWEGNRRSCIRLAMRHILQRSNEQWAQRRWAVRQHSSIGIGTLYLHHYYKCYYCSRSEPGGQLTSNSMVQSLRNALRMAAMKRLAELRVSSVTVHCCRESSLVSSNSIVICHGNVDVTSWSTCILRNEVKCKHISKVSVYSHYSPQTIISTFQYRGKNSNASFSGHAQLCLTY